MRGLFKAAALLSSSSASAFVIPDPAALEGRPSDPVIEYVLSSQAQLKFVINSVESAWAYPTLSIAIGSTEKLCAESNVTLDGQQLNSQWIGIQGTGEGTLEAYENASMSWTVTCLWDSGSPTNGGPNLGDITHLLTLKLRDSRGRKSTPGFTISYKQFGQPSVVRFEPHYTVPTSSNGDFVEWRTPTFPFADKALTVAEPFETPQPALSDTIAEPQQKSLAAGIKTIEGKIKDKVNGMVQSFKKLNINFCPKKALQALKAQQALKSQSEPTIHDELDGKAIQHDELDADEVSPDELAATPVQHHLAAATTRSLHSASTSTVDFQNPIDGSADRNSMPSGVVLKSFFLSLIVLSFLSWIILRYRDPRRRAEWAALREEVQTKRLYRRAARRQKFENMIWTFRIRWGLVSNETLRWDEKRRRVSEQEEILEDVVKDDIQALRDAHRAVSTMTSTAAAEAEEGRSRYVYGEDGSGYRRGRSVSTLPEYESEGSRPPSYRVGGRRASMEFTSDSSVVSTSPRISRDGTNSDIEEKIEEINLYEARADGLRPRV